MKIRVSIGRTYNLGYYESLRLDVSEERNYDDEAGILEGNFKANTIEDATIEIAKSCKNSLSNLEYQNKVDSR